MHKLRCCKRCLWSSFSVCIVDEVILGLLLIISLLAITEFSRQVEWLVWAKSFFKTYLFIQIKYNLVFVYSLKWFAFAGKAKLYLCPLRVFRWAWELNWCKQIKRRNLWNKSFVCGVEVLTRKWRPKEVAQPKCFYTRLNKEAVVEN